MERVKEGEDNTSLRTVSTFWCFWGAERGLERVVVRWERTS